MPRPDDSEPRRLGGTALLVLLAGFTALAPLATDIYLPVLPSLAADLAASPSAAQLTITFVLLGMAAGQLVGGPLSDQRGRRGTLLAGLIGVVLTSLLSAAAPTIGWLVAARFLAGASTALAFVVARAIVADAFPGLERARAYALLGAITGIAPVVAPVAGGLLSLVMDWRGIFVVLGVLALGLLIVGWIRLPETMPVASRQASGVSHGARDLATCLRSRRFMTYVACLAMAGGVLFTYISSSSFVLQDGFGLTPTQYAACFAVNAVGIFTVALIGRRLVYRAGPERLLWAGQSLAAAGSVVTLVALLIGSLPLTLAGLLLAIASIGLIFAQSTALGIAASPVRAGAASALLGISGFLVGGVLAPLGGLGSGGVAMGLLMLSFAALGLLLHRLLPGSASPIDPAIS